MIKLSIGILRKLLHRLPHNQQLMVCSVLVGLWSGLLAVLLKFLAHAIQSNLVGSTYGALFYSLFPLLGILVVVAITNFVFRTKLEKGVFEVVYAIARKSSRIPKQQTYSHVVTSAITVGLGGSAGLEAPIVQTGAAVGSTLGGVAQLSYKDRTLLIGCGAAAGIAASFNAPIAGVLFALEVLLAQVSVSAFIPIILAGATGALCSKVLLNEDVLLSFQLQQPFNYHNTLYYVALGILCGLFSAYYTRTYLKADKFITSIKNPWLRAGLGGFALGALILVFPPLFGEGYASIRSLGDAHPESIFATSVLADYVQSPALVIVFLLAVLMIKVWATALTVSSGGHGGSFAPAVFTGAILGFTFVYILNQFQINQTPSANFALVGMCGVLTGMFHAPLTGIFLIAEITGGYDLIIPLMIVAAVSLSVARYIQPKSLDALKLLQKGHEHTHDKDATILNTLPLADLVETDFAVMYSNETLGDLVQRISKSKRNIFPVLTSQQQFLGVIQLDDIRDKIFERDLYDKVIVDELMQPAPELIDHNENMLTVMQKFDRTKAWNLPVVRAQRYVGFVSKSKIFTAYRKQLQEQSLDF